MPTKTHLISTWKHTLHPYLTLMVTLKSVTMIVELHPRLLHLSQWSFCCGWCWTSLKPRFSWRASLTHIIRCIQTIHTKTITSNLKLFSHLHLGLSKSLFLSDFINTVCDTYFHWFWCYIPKDQNPWLHFCENIKTCIHSHLSHLSWCCRLQITQIVVPCEQYTSKSTSSYNSLHPPNTTSFLAPNIPPRTLIILIRPPVLVLPLMSATKQCTHKTNI